MTPMTVFDTFVFPSAGSAFTYASEVIHPNVGFLVGWSSLLDYLLLPMVNAVIGRIYFESFFPDAPSWIFVLVYVAIVTALQLLASRARRTSTECSSSSKPSSSVRSSS